MNIQGPGNVSPTPLHKSEDTLNEKFFMDRKKAAVTFFKSAFGSKPESNLNDEENYYDDLSLRFTFWAEQQFKNNPRRDDPEIGILEEIVQQVNAEMDIVKKKKILDEFLTRHGYVSSKATVDTSGGISPRISVYRRAEGGADNSSNTN